MAPNYAFVTARFCSKQSETKPSRHTELQLDIAFAVGITSDSWLELRETVNTAGTATVKGAEILIRGLGNSIQQLLLLLFVITFMRGNYSYMPKTKHVSRVYSVAAVLYLQLVKVKQSH